MNYHYEHPDERHFYLDANKQPKQAKRSHLDERWAKLKAKWEKEDAENERADIVNMLKVELS